MGKAVPVPVLVPVPVSLAAGFSVLATVSLIAGLTVLAEGAFGVGAAGFGHDSRATAKSGTRRRKAWDDRNTGIVV